MPVLAPEDPLNARRLTPKIALLACSLASLLLLPAWMELLPGSPGSYLYGYRVGWSAVIALALNGLMLSALLVTTWVTLAGSYPKGWSARLCVCALALLAVNALRVALLDTSIVMNLAQMVIQLGWTRFLLLYGIPVLAFWTWIWLDFPRALRAGRFVLILLAPLPLIFGARTALFLLRSPHTPAKVSAPIQARNPAKAPALLLIFDEMDQSWTFEARPARLHLPNLDRLASESVRCREAYPPTGETHKSIPSLMTGQVVIGTRTAPGRELFLSFRNEPSRWVPWSEVRDLPAAFGESRRSTLLINHYHAFSDAYLAARPLLTLKRTPYFSEWMEAEHWYDTIGSSWIRQWRCLADALPGFVHFTRHDEKNLSVPPLFRKTVLESLAGISSGAYDLIIVHWPIPHAPALVDLDTGLVPDAPPAGRSNLDNLVLVDRVLEQVRGTLEAKGLWDPSLVVVTSDHWQRKAADPNLPPAPEIPGLTQSRRRVPLLVKFPGQTLGMERIHPINNVEVFDLLDAYARDIPMEARTFAERAPRSAPLGAYRAGID